MSFHAGSGSPTCKATAVGDGVVPSRCPGSRHVRHGRRLLLVGVALLAGCTAVPSASPTISIEAECAKMLGVPIEEVELVSISLSKASETGVVAIGRMVWVTLSEREIEEEREVLRRLTTRVGSGEKASALKKEVLDVPKRQQRMRYWACQHAPVD